MIETIDGMPAGMTGFRAAGELTDAGYADVLAPALRRVAIIVDTGLLLRRSFPVWPHLAPADVKLFARDREADAKSWLAAW